MINKQTKNIKKLKGKTPQKRNIYFTKIGLQKPSNLVDIRQKMQDMLHYTITEIHSYTTTQIYISIVNTCIVSSISIIRER